MSVRGIFRGVARAAGRVHRWLMKYSGTTMIIDNVEERLRRRKSMNDSTEPSDNGSRPPRA